MSSDVLTLGNLGKEKHKRFLRHISDIFDNFRGDIPDNLAFTRFKNSSNHTILFNTLSPELDGKQLIGIDSSGDGAGGNNSILFAPIDIHSIICSDKRNNDTVGLLVEGDKVDRNRVWEATSDEKLIKLLIRLDETEGIDPPTIQGLSITFADSIKTKYRISVTLVNRENEVISQISGMESSFETNNAQFFQFTNPVDGATRIILDIELVGTNIYEWKLNNIRLYSHMNDQSLRSLGDSGIITYTSIPNNVLVREAKDDILKVEDQGKPTNKVLNKEDQGIPLKAISNTDKEFEYVDSYGSPLVAAPNLNHQYFDNIQSQQLTNKIANIKRLYSTTDLPNGKKIYTFETNPDTKNLTLTFSPTDEMNKTPDEPVYEMEQLVDRGYIKKGGFKNYCLTFYIKLDEITMQDQYLVWKYGGWLFNDQLPDLSRATDIYIPIDSGNTNPQIFTEYKHNFFSEIKDGIVVDDVPKPLLSDGKWVGFQFIRQVDEKNKTCIVDVDINLNPVDENGNFTNKEFQPFLQFNDVLTENHTPNTWGGINEIVSVSGSKYISLYGISLYELQW